MSLLEKPPHISTKTAQKLVRYFVKRPHILRKIATRLTFVSE